MKLTRLLSLAAFLASTCALLNAGTVYIDDSGGNLYAGDPVSGVFALVGNSGVGSPMADIDFTSNGSLWGVGYDSNLYSINQYTGAATLVGPDNIGFVAGMGGDDNGNLYAGGSGNIFSINTGTGAGTAIGSGQGYSISGDLEFVGSTMYGTSAETASGGTLWQIDPTTGNGAFLGETGFNSVWGMAYDTDNGVLYGYTSAGQEFTINPGNLALDAAVNTNLPTLLGNNLLYGAAYTTPEPSTWATLFAGCTLIGFVVRCRLARG
jgi:hypothetical protein